MGDVVVLNNATTLDLPPDRVLSGALGQLDQVLLLGRDQEGADYFASSTTNKTELLWLVESFKQSLLSGDFDD